MSKRKHPRRRKKKRAAQMNPQGYGAVQAADAHNWESAAVAPLPIAPPVPLALATARERLRLINLRRSVHHG